MQDGTLLDLFSFSTPALPPPPKQEKASKPVCGVTHRLRNHPATGWRDISGPHVSKPRFCVYTQERLYGRFPFIKGKQLLAPGIFPRDSRSDNRRWIYQTMLNVKHNFTTGQTRKAKGFSVFFTVPGRNPFVPPPHRVVSANRFGRNASFLLLTFEVVLNPALRSRLNSAKHTIITIC